MRSIDSVVIGAGHAGLATSNVLANAGVEHVVLERDRVASRWRNERWDSFTLLTPNWATWLPNWHYAGRDPHGFMGRDDAVQYLELYAASFASPVHEGVRVDAVTANQAGGYHLETTDGALNARSVVIATGPFQEPKLPAWARDLPADVQQLHSNSYKAATALPAGAILVIGAGPSGQQIAEDLLRAGRRVYLSVGRHRKVPRRYRGRDYYWWLEHGGSYERTAEDVPAEIRRNGVAPALTGFAGGHDLDLRQLAIEGITLLGRAVGTDGTQVRFDTGLAESLAAGDRAYRDFVDWVEARLYRFDGLFSQPEKPPNYPDPPAPPAVLDLHDAGVSTIIWATGFTASFSSWVKVDVLDNTGFPVHRRGETASPGLYFIGLSWLHRLRSPFIRGAEEDALHLLKQLLGLHRGSGHN